MNKIMMFEGHNVEIFEWNGQVLFNPYDVAECLDIADVNSSIRNFSCKQIIKITGYIKEIQKVSAGVAYFTGKNNRSRGQRRYKGERNKSPVLPYVRREAEGGKIMKISIVPRRINDKGGYACMPLKKNVPEGHADCKLTVCSECGRECWENPLLSIVKSQGAITLCTECALRKGIQGA